MIESPALRRIAIAGAVSGAAHALAIGYGHIALPETPADLPPLAVRMVYVEPAPASVKAPARAKSPTLVARARPSSMTAVPLPATDFAAGPTQTQSAVEEEVPIAEAPAEPAPEPTLVATAPASTLDAATPALPSFPRSGHITYTLVYGRDRFPVGRTTQTWKIEGTRYQLASRSETTGLIDLIRSQHRTYFSRGELTASGLRPEVFLMSRDRGRGTEEARARFDWRKQSVTLGPVTAPREQTLPHDAQDLLSFIYQLAIDPPPVGRRSVAITNGNRLDTYVLEVLPEEKLDTPLGSLRTLPIRQIRAPGVEGVDVWLALEYRHLPVRVRFYGRDGEPAGEQIVSEIRLADS